MIEAVIFIALLLLDVIDIVDIRDLVYSFLLSKRNTRAARKIHIQQTRKDRFTLSYIEEHAIYKKQFRFWHRLLIIFYCSVIPQYLILAAMLFVSNRIFLFVGFAFGGIKIIIEFLVRFQFAGRIAKFDKRYPK